MVSLKDAMEFINDRYDVNVMADSERFNPRGLDDVRQQPISLPPLYRARLGALLQVLAKQVKGVCLASAGKILIVPNEETVIKKFVAEGYIPLPPAPAVAELELQSKVLLLMIEAQDRTARKLRSGIGNGIYEEYLQTSNDTKAALRVRAKFTLQFDHKRYYLNMLDDEGRTFGSKSIIRDNSAVYIANSSRSRRIGSGQVRSLELAYVEEFPWEPCQVPRGLFDVDRWIRQPLDDIRVEELPIGGYTLHVQKGNARVSWTILERFDWNVSNWKFEFEGHQSLNGEAQVVWKKAGSVWYLASIEETSGQHRYALHFDDFKANVAISPKLFRLAALELPVGAMIYDRRDYKHDVIYRYQPIPDDGTRRFFDMEAELESLGPP